MPLCPVCILLPIPLSEVPFLVSGEAWSAVHLSIIFSLCLDRRLPIVKHHGRASLTSAHSPHVALFPSVVTYAATSCHHGIHKPSRLLPIQPLRFPVLLQVIVLFTSLYSDFTLRRYLSEHPEDFRDRDFGSLPIITVKIFLQFLPSLKNWSVFQK